MAAIRLGIIVSCVTLLAVSISAAATAPQKPTTHYGLCDASAGIALNRSLFVIGGDEDNVLRVFRRDSSGSPVQQFDLNAFLKPANKRPEVDIEGAAQIGNLVYWIGSHGTNKNGKEAPTRRRLFATRFSLDGERVQIEPVGEPYTRLVDDLAAAPQLRKYNFLAASHVIPKTPQGLNIEGLAGTPDGKLLIGFRAPIVEGHALLIPLENPKEVIAGKRAKLGKAMEFDLRGLGIRSIEYWPARQEYLIVAGPYAKGPGRVYLWSGNPEEGPREVSQVDLRGWAIEGAVLYPDSGKTTVQLISDDGAMPECENLKQGEMPRFRAGWIRIPAN